MRKKVAALLLALFMVLSTPAWAHYNSVTSTSTINCGQSGQVQFTVYGHANTTFVFRVSGTDYNGNNYTTSYYNAAFDSGGRYDGITGFWKLRLNSEGWSIKAVDTVIGVGTINAIGTHCR